MPNINDFIKHEDLQPGDIVIIDLQYRPDLPNKIVHLFQSMQRPANIRPYYIHTMMVTKNKSDSSNNLTQFIHQTYGGVDLESVELRRPLIVFRPKIGHGHFPNNYIQKLIEYANPNKYNPKFSFLSFFTANSARSKKTIPKKERTSCIGYILGLLYGVEAELPSVPKVELSQAATSKDAVSYFSSNPHYETFIAVPQEKVALAAKIQDKYRYTGLLNGINKEIQRLQSYSKDNSAQLKANSIVDALKKMKDFFSSNPDSSYKEKCKGIETHIKPLLEHRRKLLPSKAYNRVINYDSGPWFQYQDNDQCKHLIKAIDKEIARLKSYTKDNSAQVKAKDISIALKQVQAIIGNNPDWNQAQRCKFLIHNIKKPLQHSRGCWQSKAFERVVNSLACFGIYPEYLLTSSTNLALQDTSTQQRQQESLSSCSLPRIPAA